MADPALSQGQSELRQLARMLPADVQARIRCVARAETDRHSTAQVFDRTADYERCFERAPNDGKPLPSVDDIAFDPALDAPSRVRLERGRQKAAQELADFTAFKAKFDDPTAGLIDLDEPKAGKSADRLYRMLGANRAAAFLIANRTGMVPPTVAAELNGGIASNDPARLMPTINLATRLAKDHPDALTMVPPR